VISPLRVYDIERLIDTIHLSIPAVFRGRTLNKLESERRRREAGYFGLALDGQPVDEPPLALFRVGEPRPSRPSRAFRLCLEKLNRLQVNPEHLSSEQSANLAREQYGGAIRCQGFLFSFSGLPDPYEDENVLLQLLRPDRWSGRSNMIAPTIGELIAITVASGNPIRL